VIPLRDDVPSRSTPFVTIALIAINAAVFLYQLSLVFGDRSAGEALVAEFGAVPCRISGFCASADEFPSPLVTVFTSIFLHGGVLHFGANMLYLWIFGDNVEDSMGHGRFVVFYLLCGVAAVLAQALPDPASEVPMIGASGAISGVLGAYLLLYPHARVLVAIPFGFYLHTMRIPAGLVLLLWFGLQLLSNAMAQPGQGGVAFRAHIGGFVAGMILIPIFKQRRFRLRLPWG
jgi:membrane associated rhomboid family serine protease